MFFGVFFDLEFVLKIVSVEDFMMGKMVKCILGNGLDICMVIDGCIFILGVVVV